MCNFRTRWIWPRFESRKMKRGKKPSKGIANSLVFFFASFWTWENDWENLNVIRSRSYGSTSPALRATPENMNRMDMLMNTTGTHTNTPIIQTLFSLPFCIRFARNPTTTCELKMSNKNKMSHLSRAFGRIECLKGKRYVCRKNCGEHISKTFLHLFGVAPRLSRLSSRSRCSIIHRVQFECGIICHYKPSSHQHAIVSVRLWEAISSISTLKWSQHIGVNTILHQKPAANNGKKMPNFVYWFIIKWSFND